MDVNQNNSTPKKLCEFEAFLRGVYTHASDDLDLNSAGQIFSKKGFGSIFLSPKETWNYPKVVTSIMRAYAKDALTSRKAVERELREALFAVFSGVELNDGNEFECRLAKALQILDSQLRRELTSYTVFMPVGGAGEGGLPFTFGNVRFIKFNDSQLIKFKEATRRCHVSESKINERLKVLDTLKESIGFWNHTCGIVKVKARDQEAANELARVEIKDTLDTLNFFSDLTPYQHGLLYLPGERESRLMTVPMVTDSGSFYILRSRVKPLSPFDFNKFRNTKHIQAPARRLHNILKLGEGREVDNLLLTAVRWAGRAALESRKEHAFLLYTIALESIVLPGGENEQLSYRLRIRVAHLLEKQFKKRQELLKKVQVLYNIRSRIVHSGWYEVTDEDLDEMQSICIAVMLRLLSHRALSGMNSGKDLERWFEERMIR